jgi:aspartate aminotransferase
LSIVSRRAAAADRAFDAVKDFYFTSRYGERRGDRGIADFTFGNPHEMPLAGLVAAIREAAQPHNKDWFAYKSSEEAPQAFLAGVLGTELGLAFEPPDIALTAGAFAAISVAFRLLLDAGDAADGRLAKRRIKPLAPGREEISRQRPAETLFDDGDRLRERIPHE